MTWEHAVSQILLQRIKLDDEKQPDLRLLPGGAAAVGP